MKKLSVIALVFILLVSLLGAATADEEDNRVVFTGKVTGSKLHMRSAPDSGASIINSYNPGTKVQILENDGTWCYVKVGSTTGYMMTKYLTITSNFSHLYWGKTPEQLKILSLLTKPDAASAPVAQFFSGSVIDILAEEGNFYKARLNDRIGYIGKEYITVDKGEYESAVYSPSMSLYPAADGTGSTYLKEYGEEITVSGNTGDASYRFTYPVTANGKADAMISKWLKELKSAFPENGKGTMTVDYESTLSDGRYASVTLYAEYEDGYGRCTTMKGFTLDITTGELISIRDIVADRTRVMLILESKINKMLPKPSEGYGLEPDDRWFDNAVVNQDGLRVDLPEGLYVPGALGNQSILLTWNTLTNCIDLPGELAVTNKIDPTKPMVCFTFDDGPADTSERLMDAFLANGGHCTFCVQGHRISNYESVVRRMVAEGHEIACHTYNHKKLTELSSSKIRYQLTETQKVLSEIVDYQIKWLRCPYGSCNKTVRSICKEYDMCIAYWTIDTEDWSTQNATSTYNAILKEVKNGAIILCHDLYPATAAGIEMVLPKLREQGYQLVTLSEMFSFMDGGPVPGTVYTQLKDEDNLGLK